MANERDGRDATGAAVERTRRSVLEAGSASGQPVSPLRWLVLVVPVLVILAAGGLLVRSLLNQPPVRMVMAPEPRREAAPPVRPTQPAPVSAPAAPRPTDGLPSLPKIPWLADAPPPPPSRPRVPSSSSSSAPSIRLEGKPWTYDVADVIARLPHADLRNGRAVFMLCAICHTAERTGGHRVGPKLWNILGREKASHPDFSYSQALKRQGGRWTYEDMARYLYDTRTAVPGGKMAFAGIRDPARLADVIAFMRTLADTPEPLPKSP